MKYEVLQSTQYRYSKPVKQSINKCIFKPISDEKQKLLSYEQKINPAAKCFEHLDYWGNDVVTFYVWQPHDQLQVQTVSILELYSKQRHIELTFEMEQEMKSEKFKEEFAEFLMTTDYTFLTKEMIDKVANELKVKEMDSYSFVLKLNEYIFKNFTYQPGSTHVKTIASEAFQNKSGVCQDFTHIMLSICRSFGLPSRYVSGYIYSGEDVAMRGDSVTHAWVEVFFPRYGWIGFDPTNNVLALDQHISVAKGRDYADITPLKGVYLGDGTQELNVSIRVKAI